MFIPLLWAARPWREMRWLSSLLPAFFFLSALFSNWLPLHNFKRNGHWAILLLHSLSAGILSGGRDSLRVGSDEPSLNHVVVPSHVCSWVGEDDFWKEWGEIQIAKLGRVPGTKARKWNVYPKSGSFQEAVSLCGGVRGERFVEY